MTNPLPSEQAARCGVRPDPAQAHALERLDRLVAEAWEPPAAPPTRWRLGRRRPAPEPRRGLYLWGPPGRGKTFLMDCAFAAAPEPKARVHFFEFFRSLYRDLHSRFQGRAEPARAAVRARFGDHRLVCFDEFHVHDIADAMLLQAFLAEAAALPGRLVFTSNYPPERLLDDSRFKERFSLGLALLETKFEVLPVDGGVDYRRHSPALAGELFLHPLSADSERGLLGLFLACEPATRLPLPPATRLEVAGRPLAAVACAGRTLWAGFDTLCAESRSSEDYLDLAGRFDTLILSGVTARALAHPWTAQRFVWLVDIRYDAGVTLALSSEAPIGELIARACPVADLARLESRLAEMELWQLAAVGRAVSA